jgi:hypothetical protein
MSYRKTIAALVILVLVAAGWFFIARPHAKRVQDEKDAKEKILSLDWDNLEKIRIVQGSNETVLSKADNDRWKIQKPFDDDADKFSVQGIVSAVRTAKPDRILESPEGLAGYGLDTPRLTAEFTAKGVRATLLLGAAHSIGDTVFAKVADVKQVLVVPGSVFTSLAKSPDGLRDKSMVPSTMDDPEKIQVFHAGELAYTLLHEKLKPATEEKANKEEPAGGEEYRWKLAEPAPWWRADTRVVDDVLRGIRNLRIEEVLKESPDNKAERGFEPPKMTLKLFYADGHSVSVDFGEKFGDMGHVLAIPPKGYLATVRGENIAKIDIAPETLRDKSLMNFNVSDVLKIALHRPETSFILIRPSGGDFSSEGAESIDSEKVLDGLRRLVDLGGKKILEGPEGDQARLALAQPELAISLEGEGGKALGKFIYAKAKIAGRSEPVPVAMGGAGDAVFEMDPAALTGWPEKVGDLQKSPANAAAGEAGKAGDEGKN